MWSPNELLKIEKQRDILSYITLQFFHFKKVPLEHCPFGKAYLFFCVCSGRFTLRQLSRRLLQQWGQTLPWRFLLGRSLPAPSPSTPAHGRGGW